LAALPTVANQILQQITTKGNRYRTSPTQLMAKLPIFDVNRPKTRATRKTKKSDPPIPKREPAA
jgi:hypothetical protein